MTPGFRTPDRHAPPQRRRTPAAAPGFRRPFSPLWFGVACSACCCSPTSSRPSLEAGPDDRLLAVQVAARAGPRRRSGRRHRKRSAANTRTARTRKSPFHTVRVDDPEARRAARSAERHASEASGRDRWVTELLSWVLPFLLIVGAVDVLLPADGRRRGRHHVVRAQPREDLRGRRRQGQLRGRRRRRRGRGRAARDRRVPEEPEEVHDARRPHPQGRAARRAARAPARRCSRARSPAKPRFRSSA